MLTTVRVEKRLVAPGHNATSRTTTFREAAGSKIFAATHGRQRIGCIEISLTT
jgi:hypothetical protein